MEPRSTDLELHMSGALPYLLARPPGSAGAAVHPVLCFLHGRDEGAPLEIRRALTRHGPLSATGLRAGAGRFIIVAPQMPTLGDLWHRHADEVRALVERVAGEHGGDRSRLFLTGFSFGANGVWDVALEHPGFWSALWTVDPTRIPPDDPRVPVWLSAGELSRRFEGDFIHQLGLEPLEAGPPGDRVYCDEGLDHVRTASAAYGDDRVYRWMLSRNPPKSTQGDTDRARSAPGESSTENRAENDDRA
jgi:hypothetical protein